MARTLGILGTGHLAEFIVCGLHRANAPYHIRVSPRNAGIAARLVEMYGVMIAQDNQEVLLHSDLVLVCLPAATGIEVLRGLQFRDDQTVCSAMAGVRLEDVQAAVTPARAAITMMPGASNSHGMGPCLLCPDGTEWRAFLAPLGRVLAMPDQDRFDIAASFGALSGASYVFMAQLSRWFEDQGLPQETARRLVAETLSGNAAVLIDELRNWEDTCANVATPGGITEDLVNHLQNTDALNAWTDGLSKVLARFREG